MNIQKLEIARDLLNERDELYRALSIIRSDNRVNASINLSVTSTGRLGAQHKTEIEKVKLPEKFVQDFKEYAEKRISEIQDSLDKF